MSEQALTGKMARFLQLSAGKSGMYDGDRWDNAPRTYRRLAAMGFVREEAPYNPVHKSRAVITEAGRAALAAWEGQHDR